MPAPDRDTNLGGPSREQPATRLTLLERAASADPVDRKAAHDALIAAYWKPVYASLRMRWRLANEDAKDLTQGFFAHVLERDLLARYDRTKSRFRTWLRRLLDAYTANEHERASAQKRGGDRPVVPLDAARADEELGTEAPVQAADVDAAFEREWQRALLADALERLRARCEELGRARRYDLLVRADVDGADESMSYRDLGAAFELDVTQVTNELHAARRDFRACVLELLRERTVDEDDFARERRALTGDSDREPR